MDRGEPRIETRILLDLLDRGFDRASWHGPNLRGSIRGIAPGAASWRPGPGRHCIAEHVLHAAYWKYAVRRRIRGERRGRFALKGSNWFPVGPDLDDREWRGHIQLLEEEHRALRLAVAELPADRLAAEAPPGGRFDFLAMIEGAAAHDVYHAGQIQLLRRLQSVGIESTGEAGGGFDGPGAAVS